MVSDPLSWSEFPHPLCRKEQMIVFSFTTVKSSTEEPDSALITCRRFSSLLVPFAQLKFCVMPFFFFSYFWFVVLRGKGDGEYPPHPPPPLSFCEHFNSLCPLWACWHVFLTARSLHRKASCVTLKGLCVLVMLIECIAPGDLASLSVMLIHLLPRGGGAESHRSFLFSALTRTLPFGMEWKGAWWGGGAQQCSAEKNTVLSNVFQ